MSILDSIKGERKLSFRHWRYRLLHWTFGVRNPDPKNPEATGMPRFLYTHYCPLFHLTNLIAILSPLILLAKVVAVFVRAVAAAFAVVPWERLLDLLARLKLPRRTTCEAAEALAPTPPSPAELRRMCVDLICEWHNDSFAEFWACHRGGDIAPMKEEDAAAVFAEFWPKVAEARERGRLRKEKWRQRIVFWTNFSRVFIKHFLTAFYVALAAGVAYLAYLIAGPTWDGICWIANGIVWLFSDTGSLTVLWTGIKISFWLAFATATVYVLARLGWIQRFWEVLCDGLGRICPPFYLVGRFWRWLCGGCSAVAEFVAMFYEENCPPITLVSDEEGAVEEVAEKAEQEAK